LPAPILPVVRTFWSQPKNFISLGQHVAALPVSAAQAAAVSSVGDLPLVVLSGDHHPAPYADWQRDLAQLSSRGVQIVAGDSGHGIHLDRPELVTQVIREVVGVARFMQRVEIPTLAERSLGTLKGPCRHRVNLRKCLRRGIGFGAGYLWAPRFFRKRRGFSFAIH